MISFSSLSWSFAVLLGCLYSVTAQCNVNIRNDLPIKDPLYVTKDGKLWAPSGPSLEWAKSEESMVICSGGRNSLSDRGSSEAVIKCHSKNEFKVGNNVVKSSDLECVSGITGDVMPTKEKCGKTGMLFHIGFKTEQFGFIEYIDVCYDTKIASAIYTYHVLRGASVNDSVSYNIRPTFKVTGTPSHVKPADSYKQAYQKEQFAKLLGSKSEAEQYFNKTSFLARGHLSPDNDGIFKSWMHSTYFYINAAPQWQAINSGNWLRIENLARKIAAQYGDDMEVYTGVTGVLTLPNTDGEEVPISLEDNGNIVVPRFFWKILIHDQEGIAFITSNNPFSNRKEEICKNVCKKLGWDNPIFEDHSRGYTYCCTVQDLKKAIRVLPSEVKAKKIMKPF